ncbi:AhpC/TSA family protein [Singulisphaera sp. GP187]|uniref:redoxin domain-containing protein n=1 Tax=Singulisphaera sp. GP187 TaxID=1882752 RepID=UPI000925A7E1|nr:redoxin domain-containing protein [Singulisphaera sp. GP187]SIO65662.1 AhpC/TSA family protein [Singulisphaera sp. GP187]
MQHTQTKAPIRRSVLILLIFMTGAQANEPREIRGRVVDEAGKPVADAAVGFFWRANGASVDRDGKPYDLTKAENVRLFWGRLGEMEPTGRAQPTKTGADGRFSIKDPDPYFAVMAMDSSRRQGGIALLPKSEGDELLEIRLVPLVTVRGSLEGPGPGQQPSWTHVYVHLPEDPIRPLHSTRFVSCGSFEAKFEFRLPPGKYTLQAYSQFADKDAFEGELVPDKAFVLGTESTDCDLGRLRLVPHRPTRQTLEEQAKANGSWNDYTQHYGESPPRWHATDARGVSKDVRMADFRGKWVLLDFWGLGCRPCLSEDLPRLIRFYEEHAPQRDQFEILSICIDFDGELKSMADVDRALAPIVKHVWGGKTLPFPILLDPTFKTWERFGLPGLGTAILIDPDGKLIKGDESVLAEKLKERAARPR